MPNEIKTDDKKVSSPSTEANSSESSTEHQDEIGAPASMLEAVTASLKKQDGEDGSDSSDESGQGQELTESKEEADTEDKPEGESDEEGDASEDKDGKKPDDKKEEVDGAKDKSKDGKSKKEDVETEADKAKDPLDRLAEKFKDNPGITNLIAQHKAMKPDAEVGRGIQDYLKRNKISQQDFNEAMQITALRRADPAKAYESLKQFVDKLGEEVGRGNVLPADLSQRVSEGKLDEEGAREIWQLRKQKEIETGQKTMSDQERRTRDFAVSMDTWVSDKMKTDADYKQKTNGDADGLFEMTEAKFAIMVHATPPKTPAEAVALAEKAYAEVKRTFTTRLTPRKSAVKMLRSNRGGSSNKHSAEPTSIEEAIQLAASRH